MKKTYINPAMDVMQIRGAELLLAESSLDGQDSKNSISIKASSEDYDGAFQVRGNHNYVNWDE